MTRAFITRKYVPSTYSFQMPLQVRKGFTLVKLRSQHDIDKGQSLDDAVATETQFFRENPFYRYKIKVAQTSTVVNIHKIPCFSFLT